MTASGDERDAVHGHDAGAARSTRTVRTTESTGTTGAAGLTPARARRAALRCLAGSLTLVTVLGHLVPGFEQPCLAPVAGAATGVAAELVLESLDAWACLRRPRYLSPRSGRAGGTLDFFLPSYVTGLLCAMFLYGGGRLSPVVLATLVGVSGRYVLRFRGTGGPVLNPAALGTATVLLLSWNGAAPYRFTAVAPEPFDVVAPPVVLGLGVALHAGLTGRLPLLAGWAGGFAAQAVVRGVLSGVSVMDALLPVTGVAFALYTVYVVADPDTTPAGRRAQVVFGAATAAVHGLLVVLGVDRGPFLALVAVCACRGAALAVRARWRRRAARALAVSSAARPAVSPGTAPAASTATAATAATAEPR
ncbi:enediyne biosynthesis protein UnbU [Streptosporangium sandarakinum]|uniref:enediyne biosynthesis protein UnbU n=1 Tax=Streptosporangium sandarakinum TaxID=1260955 RepID=UPI00342DD3FE